MQPSQPLGSRVEQVQRTAREQPSQPLLEYTTRKTTLQDFHHDSLVSLGAGLAGFTMKGGYSTMETERAKRLANFVSWVGANIKGDEKGEAQLFLDRFFRAFGHAGLKEAGATLEERIRKAHGITFRGLGHAIGQ